MLKILSLDGGGTRGILSATVLAQLELEMQKTDPDFRIRDAFDIVAGTSTGGMIALNIGLGVPMQKLVDVYLNDAKQIFHDSIWDNIKDLGSTFGAQYDQDSLKELLLAEDLLGNKTFKDIDKWQKNGKGVKVLIPTFDLSPDPQGPNRNFCPHVFHSNYKRDHNESLINIALRTTAAPTYFPVYESKFVDGGVAINNPSMAAIAFAMNRKRSDKPHYGGAGYKQKGLGVPAKDIVLISLGTGTSGAERVEPDEVGKGDWGATQWLSHFSSMLTISNMRASEYYAESVLAEENYFRHQFDLMEIDPDGKVAMDCTDEETLQKMVDLAKNDFAVTKNQLLALVSKESKSIV